MVLSRILTLLEMGPNDRVCVLNDEDGSFACFIQKAVSLYLPIVSVNLSSNGVEYPRVFQVKTDPLSYANSNPKVFTKILVRDDIDPIVIPKVIEMLIPKKDSRLLIVTHNPDQYVDYVRESGFEPTVFPFQDSVFLMVSY